MRILDAVVTRTSIDRTGSVSGGFLQVQGVLNRVYWRSEKDASLHSTGERLHNVETYFDTPQRFPKQYFALPLQIDQDIPLPYERFCVFTFLVLEESSSGNGHYIRCGMGCSRDTRDHYLLMHIREANDIPCEVFLGERQGYQFKIF
jgi:hypothetical protein